jgi:MFS family permease
MTQLPQKPDDIDFSLDDSAGVEELAPPLPDESSTSTVDDGPYASWRLPNFRRYAFSWFCMTIARQMESVALAVYVYAKTGNVLSLGIVALMNALPVMLFAIPAGQLADRIDRRLILGCTVALALLISTTMLVLCAMQVDPLWIYPCLALNGLGQALGGPARTSLLPWLVPNKMFRNAVSWNSTIFHLATMIGPAVGGAVIGLSATRGVPFALLGVALWRLMALAGIVTLQTARPQVVDAVAVTFDSLAAGVRFVVRHKPILAAISLDLFAVLLGGATYLLPPLAKESLHVRPEQVGACVGWLRSAEALGAICMAFLLAHLPAIRRAGPTMLCAVAVFGLATIALGLAPTLPLALLAMFLIGAFDNVSVVIRHTMIQMLTPDSMRGRVSAVNNVFIVASNDLGGLESGLTAFFFGTIPSIILGGVGSIMVVIATAVVLPQILKIGSLADLKPKEE